MSNDEDMVKGIPQMAFINAQIIQSAIKNSAFMSCVDQVSRQYNIPRFPVIMTFPHLLDHLL